MPFFLKAIIFFITFSCPLQCMLSNYSLFKTRDIFSIFRKDMIENYFLGLLENQKWDKKTTKIPHKKSKQKTVKLFLSKLDLNASPKDLNNFINQNTEYLSQATDLKKLMYITRCSINFSIQIKAQMFLMTIF